ncbi:hypothetical protein BD309DRAFT_1053371 [Dichomitus squalens]|nr:hypothetical protein BD309DRAFT_1053371 [Dichomitus squalens]
MGRKTWRLQEEQFLDQLVNTPKGNQRLARVTEDNSDMWWKETVDWLMRAYKKEFNYCFGEEMAENFATHQKMQPRAKLSLFPPETEEDLELRAIVFIPSLLLHVAVVFFFTGLLILLWTLHPTVAVAASAFVGALVVFQLVVTILPTIRWDCCYRSPQAVAVYIMYSVGRDGLIRMVQAGARSIRRLTQYRFRCLATLDLWARRLEETPGWRGRERSDILHATGELDRSIAVMPYTTTLSTH